MLTVISPAKSLDMTPTDIPATMPEFSREAASLAATMRGRNLGDVKAMMGLSDDLAKLNRDRYRAFSPDPEPEATRPAAFMFNGDTYTGLDARSLSEDDLRWAQDHLRILSGLYGLLKPADAIQPYRLEMGTRLKTRRGKNLYDYWGDTLAKTLVSQAKELNTDTVVNCASVEYFTALDRPALSLKTVTPTFMEVKDGKPRIVSFFAKKARGAMARFITQNRLTDASDLRMFNTGGYAFEADLSTPDKPVFLRDYPETT